MCRGGAFALAIVTFCATVSAVPPRPALEYRFNGTGTFESSSGFDPAPVTFYDAAGNVRDMRGTAGSGVSGFPGDRAFDNTASTAMGEGGVGGAAISGYEPPSLDNVTSLTITGWYKTDGNALPTNKARLVMNSNGRDAGFQLGGGDISNGGMPGTLSFQTHPGPATSVSDPAYTDAGTWTFFALTKSFNEIEETLRFYKGGTGDSAVTLVTLGGSAAEPVRAGLPLQIGNRIDLVRPFDGLIDNVRVFAATSGTGGVLPLADLEFIRLADLANVPIPEPGGAACALAFLGVVLRRRRA